MNCGTEGNRAGVRKDANMVSSCRAPWLWAFVATLCCLLGTAQASRAQDHLIFCNNPEKIRTSGAVADAMLKAGESYTIFYHFKNVSGMSGPFVVALHAAVAKPLLFTARTGFADPQHDPPLAGRQAMARFLSGVDTVYKAKNGNARFDYYLANRHVASGVLTVRCNQDTRMRIYFRHDRWTVPDESVIQVDAPRQEVAIALKNTGDRQTYRIGEPERELKRQQRHLDGTYGMLYAFKVAAPAGRRVRVSFSPRGGKGGLVGSLNGNLHLTEIVPATAWRVFIESKVGKQGFNLTTAPFGGVFYPVELVFQLI